MRIARGCAAADRPPPAGCRAAPGNAFPGRGPAAQKPEPNEGDVVIARLGHEITLKYFHRAGRDRIELQPRSSNPEHKPIVIDGTTADWEIVGVVVSAMIGARPTAGC